MGRIKPRWHLPKGQQRVKIENMDEEGGDEMARKENEEQGEEDQSSTELSFMVISKPPAEKE